MTPYQSGCGGGGWEGGARGEGGEGVHIVLGTDPIGVSLGVGVGVKLLAHFVTWTRYPLEYFALLLELSPFVLFEKKFVSALYLKYPFAAEVGNILSRRLIMKYFLRSFSPFRWFKKGSCQFLAKECAQYWLTA